MALDELNKEFRKKVRAEDRAMCDEYNKPSGFDNGVEEDVSYGRFIGDAKLNVLQQWIDEGRNLAGLDIKF